MTHIVAIGECMLEMAPISPGAAATFQPGFAGDTSNAMIYLKRAADDINVTYVTALGDDQYSEDMINFWHKENIATRVTRIPNALPGLYLIENSASGERNFHFWRGQSAYRQLIPGLIENPLADANQVYISGISVAATPKEHRETLLQWVIEAKANGSAISFDPNYREALWPDADEARRTLEAYWQICDRFLGSDEDLAALGEADIESFAASLLSGSTAEVLIRRGAEPCLIFQPNHTVSVPAKSCIAVDTTGAGDSFNGTYLAARLTGINTEEAARRGHAVAAGVVQHQGAILPRE